MGLRSKRVKMNIGLYGILIVFGAFVLLLIFNPKFSCFGKKLKSPLYPVLRRKSLDSRRKMGTNNYDLDLGGRNQRGRQEPHQHESQRKDLKTQDYGFDLGGGGRGSDQPAGRNGVKADSQRDHSSDPSGE